MARFPELKITKQDSTLRSNSWGRLVSGGSEGRSDSLGLENNVTSSMSGRCKISHTAQNRLGLFSGVVIVRSVDPVACSIVASEQQENCVAKIRVCNYEGTCANKWMLSDLRNEKITDHG